MTDPIGNPRPNDPFDPAPADVEALVADLPYSLTMWAKGMPTVGEMRKTGFEGVIFPKIELDREERLEWLEGLSINFERMDGEPWRISEVLVQNRLALDEKGAAIESAAAVSMAKSITMPLVIDEPFFLVIFREENGIREGSGFPILAAYIDFSQ